MCAVTNGLARWQRRQPYKLTALIGFQCRNVDHLRHCSSRQSYGFVGQTMVALQPCSLVVILILRGAVPVVRSC